MTVSLTNAKAGKEFIEFFAAEEFHEKVDSAIGGVDDEFVDLDNVRMAQLDDVLELSPEIGKGLFVTGHNPLDGELISGFAVNAATDQPESAFAKD